MSNARRIFGRDFDLLTPGQARFLIDLAEIPMNTTQLLTVRGHQCGIERHSDGHLSGYLLLPSGTDADVDGISTAETQVVRHGDKLEFDYNSELDYVPLNLEPQPHASYKDSKHVRAELTRIVNRLAS